MKKLLKTLFIASLSLIMMGCNNPNESPSTSTSDSISTSVSQTQDSGSTDVSSEPRDFVNETKLDLTDSNKAYAEVSVKSYVDGDTTHFIPKGNPKVWIKEEFLKARYCSVDTPESTGKVEEWGKYASLFTKEKLSSASSIILQSDFANWKTDTTGGRYLVWVWYQPEANADYRLLNLELIQNGIAKLKSANEYSMYDTFMAANNQAMKFGYKIYSNGKEKDPYYYYGKAKSVTMKELRTNAKDYEGTKVSVEGLVTVYDGNHHMAYAQAFDVEDNRWYGMNFYAGFTRFPPLVAGNYLRLVGTLSWYAPDLANPDNGSWQVSGLLYLPLTPDNEGSMKILEKNVEVVPYTVTADDLSLTKENDEDKLTKGEKAESTYVSMSDLTVKSVYTTQSTDIISNGALTLTCLDEENKEVTIRTSVLKIDDDTLLTESDVLNKTISVKGVVNKYNGKLQVHVFTINDIEIA